MNPSMNQIIVYLLMHYRLSDKRVLYVAVGCGRCMECLKQKARDWNVRLLEDIRGHTNGVFVTLTFNEDSYNKLSKLVVDDGDIFENNLSTLAVRLFLERWRKKYKNSVRHWLVTELGHTGTNRIHLHGIIYTNNVDDIEKIWQYGFVYIGKFVNERTVNYIVKYLHKLDLHHKNFVGKVLCSKGIGSNYLNTYNSSRNSFNGEDTKEYYTTRQGYKLALPIYYRNKIYSEEEKEILRLNKLDKEVRFVNGEKVSIKDGLDEYEKLRNFYVKINSSLGYGDDSVNFDKKYYNYKINLIKHYKKSHSG